MTVSLWQDTAAWPGEIEHERIVADIAIVGGGIVGATLATLLAGSGRDVVVLEAGYVGSGASGRNAGHCVAGLRSNYHLAVETYGREAARALRLQMMDNRDMVQRFCDTLEVPYEQKGSQCLAMDADDAADLRACVEAFQADGFDVEYSEKDPYDRGFVARLYQPGDFWLQPYLLVSRLFASSGARVLENCEVREIDQQGETVTIRGRRATVECRQAVIATNAWSRTLHEYFRDKVFPVRAQMFATEPTSEPRLIEMPTGINAFKGSGGEYFRQLPDGRFLIGGFRTRYTDEEVGLGNETTPHLQAAMQGWVKERFPELANLQVTHRWAGIMGFSVDGLPLIGRLPDMPNIYFSVGFTGAGVSYGPLAARQTVEYMLDGTHPGLFHVDRLA